MVQRAVVQGGDLSPVRIDRCHIHGCVPRLGQAAAQRAGADDGGSAALDDRAGFGASLAVVSWPRLSDGHPPWPKACLFRSYFARMGTAAPVVSPARVKFDLNLLRADRLLYRHGNYRLQ